MMPDDRVHRCTTALGGIASLPLVFQPPKKGDPERDPVALALADDFWKFFPESEQTSCIAWGRLAGVSLQHIDDWRLDPDTGRVLPVSSVWSIGALRYDFQIEDWFVMLADGTEVRISEQPERWWLHCPYGRRRPWAKAPWRGVARWWLLKQYAQSDWAHFSERQGEGTQVVTEKDGEYTAGLNDEERKELAKQINELGRNAVIVLPKGFDYKVAESVARSWETFKAQTECADAGISIALCGQNLTSQVKDGSRAAATVHDQVEGRVITSEAAALSTDLHDGPIVRYAEFNFGKASLAPYPTYDTKPATDKSARADVLVKVSQALSTFKTAGVAIDEELLAQIETEFSVKLSVDERAQVLPPKPTVVAAREDSFFLEHGPLPHVHEKYPDYNCGCDRCAARAGVQTSAQDDLRIDNGQRYADRVAQSGTDAATRGLAPTVAAMLSAVSGAASYADALQAIKDKYAGLRTPAELVRLTEAALVMTELGGQLSAVEHVEADE